LLRDVILAEASLTRTNLLAREMPSRCEDGMKHYRCGGPSGCARCHRRTPGGSSRWAVIRRDRRLHSSIAR